VIVIETAAGNTAPFHRRPPLGVGEMTGVSAVGQGSAAVKALDQHLAFIS
jgi:hypothetical protein